MIMEERGLTLIKHLTMVAHNDDEIVRWISITLVARITPTSFPNALDTEVKCVHAQQNVS